MTGPAADRIWSASRAVAGDVFELWSPNGFAYVQCTYPAELSVVRVLPGLFHEPPSDQRLRQLVAGPERWFQKLRVDDAVRLGGLRHVATLEVPARAARPSECVPEEVIAWDYFVERVATGCWEHEEGALGHDAVDDERRFVVHIFDAPTRAVAATVRRAVEARGFLTALWDDDQRWFLHVWLEWKPEDPEGLAAWLRGVGERAGAQLVDPAAVPEAKPTVLRHDVADELVELAVRDNSTTEVEAALRRAATAGARLDPDDGERALAAAELVAAARGNPTADLPDDALRWASAQPALQTPESLSNARKALAVVAGRTSALRELYTAPEEDDWLHAVEDLQRRLEVPRDAP